MVQLICTQVVTCLIQYYIATTEKIKNIFWVTFLFNVANMLCYALNSDMMTVAMYIIICVRSFIYVYRDEIKKHRWHSLVPIICVLLQGGVGFAMIENPWQLIPTIIPCYVCIYMWFYDTTQKLRIGNIIGNGAWGIYNTVTGLYIVAVGRLITVIMNIVAYIRNRKKVDITQG